MTGGAAVGSPILSLQCSVPHTASASDRGPKFWATSSRASPTSLIRRTVSPGTLRKILGKCHFKLADGC